MGVLGGPVTAPRVLRGILIFAGIAMLGAAVLVFVLLMNNPGGPLGSIPFELRQVLRQIWATITNQDINSDLFPG